MRSKRLTTVEAAAELGVSAARVRALIGAGRLAARKTSKGWRIRRTDLDAVRDRKPGPPAGVRSMYWDRQRRLRRQREGRARARREARRASLEHGGRVFRRRGPRKR